MLLIHMMISTVIASFQQCPKGFYAIEDLYLIALLSSEHLYRSALLQRVYQIVAGNHTNKPQQILTMKAGGGGGAI